MKSRDGKFLTDFDNFILMLLLSSGKLLNVGNFNIHVDNLKNFMAGKFISLLDSLRLAQHVRYPTHLGGYTHELVITRANDTMVTHCSVSD